MERADTKTAPTAGALLREGSARLRAAAAGQGSGAELDARVLLAHAWGVAPAHLAAHDDEVPGPDARGRYRGLIERRAAGEPVAYLTGRREFWSLELAVTPDVLVPRPETELLVERALALGGSGELRVADLGTGSGAIAIALACERPAWHVTATDVSPRALAVARANAARLAPGRVGFREGGWFAPLGGERFDLIVSNPPYVAADDPALADAALAHEPRDALTPGGDGLAALLAIVRGAPAHLVPGGWLLLEHGAAQGEAVRRALVGAGFGSVRSHRDLAGHERVTEGQHDQI